MVAFRWAKYGRQVITRRRANRQINCFAINSLEWQVDYRVNLSGLPWQLQPSKMSSAASSGQARLEETNVSTVADEVLNSKTLGVLHFALCIFSLLSRTWTRVLSDYIPETNLWPLKWGNVLEAGVKFPSTNFSFLMLFFFFSFAPLSRRSKINRHVKQNQAWKPPLAEWLTRLNKQLTGQIIHVNGTENENRDLQCIWQHGGYLLPVDGANLSDFFWRA